MTPKKAVLVYGAGISGCGAAEELVNHGREVILYNDAPKTLDEKFADNFLAKGGKFAFGKNEGLLERVDTMVISPAISIYSPFVVKAQALGIEVISEVELAARYYKGHMAAITGTNGKTTTTTLVGEMFATLPVKSAVGGNIGLALSKEIKDLDQDSWLAAEISSFQLEAVKYFRADIAVILNLTPDHIDRHRTMEEYGRVKQRIFANQTPKDYTVLNYDDPVVRSWAANSKGTVCFFSRKEALKEGICLEDGIFVINWKGKKHLVCHKDELKVFGGHNEENVLAAIACGFFAGVTLPDMRKVLTSFAGVEHRLEYVTTINKVPYYNDSKATNPDSTIKALEAFPHGHIILIAGGRDKKTDIVPLMHLIRQKVDELILLGEAKDRFEEAAHEAAIRNVIIVQTFKEAVEKAYKLAREPQVVLLSPACASFDMFANFPARGKAFKELVAQIAAEDGNKHKEGIEGK